MRSQTKIYFIIFLQILLDLLGAQAFIYLRSFGDSALQYKHSKVKK